MTKLYTVSQWLLFFYIYSFIGWIWESAYVSVCKRKLVNRGFLKGPFLPLYGSGAVCILAVTIPVRGNIPLMFLTGMIFASALEYVTGAVMERIFRVRYWDYSDKFLNVNGYICLASSLCWGVMTILMVDVVQVHMEPLVLDLSDRITRGAVMVLTPYFAVDFVTSFIAAIHLRDALIRNDRIGEELKNLEARKLALEKELERIRAELQEAGDRTYEQLRDRLREAGDRTYGQLRDRLQEAGDRTYGQLRDRLQETGDRAYEQLQEKLEGAGGKAYSQLREELKEIYVRTGEYREKLRLGYTKSTRGLLRRNPHAVSRIYKESFAELKKNVVEKLEEIRR